MAKNLKLSLIAILSVLGFYQLQAQNPRINGRSGSVTYQVPAGWGKTLEASGCAPGSKYNWSFTRKDYNGRWESMAGDWDLAYGGAGDGSNVTAITNPFTSSFPNIENEIAYQYKVECSIAGVVQGSSTTANIITIRYPKQYVPRDVRVIGVSCGDLNNSNAGGRVTMEADGCYQETQWTDTKGNTIDSPGPAYAVTNDYAAGTYQVACTLEGYNYNTGQNETTLSGKKSITIGKYYAPPAAFSTYFPDVPDNTKFDIKVCKNSGGYKIVTNINYELYQQYFDISWKWDNMGKGSKTIATNVGSITTNFDGIFTMTVKARDQYCGSRESYNANSRVEPLTNATIEGIKQYCPDGGTTVLTATNATNGDKYDWYVNGVLSTTLGTAATATIGETLKLKVGYTSKNSDSNNIGCKSDVSDEVSITIFDRPKTPTITALTRLRYCDVELITAKLQSSLDSLSGAATKFLWSNALTTREVDINKAGLYTVKVTDINGCTSLESAPTEIQVLPISAAPDLYPKTPTITALTKLGFCAETPIAAKLQSSLDSLSGAATKFLWSNALTTREVDINKAGLYTVKVIDINGCVSLSSAATEVKVLPLPAAPVIAAGGPTIFCQRADADFGTFNSVTLTATSANDVTWYGKLSTAKLLAGKVLAGVKISDTYFTTATDLNGCISKNSNQIKVTVQTNPAITSDTKIVKEGVYTIKALNFPSAATANATSAGEYEWKFGSAVLISKTYVSKVKTAGDYTTRRKYLYTIEGTPLTCFTDLVKYAYVVDPEFKGVAIYPNPITSSNVTIEILDDWTGADVSIYDMVGRPVFAGKIASSDGTDGRNTLNVGGLGNGIYVLQVKGTGDKSYVGKIIVNK